MMQADRASMVFATALLLCGGLLILVMIIGCWNVHLKKKAELKRLSDEFRFQKTISRPYNEGGMLSYTTPPGTAMVRGRYGADADPYGRPPQMFSPRQRGTVPGNVICYGPPPAHYAQPLENHPAMGHGDTVWQYDQAGWTTHRQPPASAAPERSPRGVVAVKYYEPQSVGTTGGYYDQRMVTGQCECCMQHRMMTHTTSYPAHNPYPMMMRTEPLPLNIPGPHQAPPPPPEDTRHHFDQRSQRSTYEELSLKTNRIPETTIDENVAPPEPTSASNPLSNIAQKFLPQLFRQTSKNSDAASPPHESQQPPSVVDFMPHPAIDDADCSFQKALMMADLPDGDYNQTYGYRQSLPADPQRGEKKDHTASPGSVNSTVDSRQ
eukprot:Blabericola_migrator_1__4332@NODE_2330_length_2927_cov_7_248601_g1460_i0_p1_GENE_NODE_2330_length_2927_cov_7_248601_g1460_i0NODE_2330_length_2927_cov_7_248601_g1460_i0_p1_ORF_typecomplete_len379_score41_40TMEM100/PF16311_5/0_026Orthoreo_P10/PF07204_11/0_15CD34_antigen/PF06365_12/0_18CD34_antigen/PF06365_12/3_5e03_NODE_2330_length_2927_cov_7_248601_g1460_i0771213